MGGTGGAPGASGARDPGVDAAAFATAAGGDVRPRPGEVFRDCAECPEMVVLPGGNLAMARYEVTVGEYRAFAAATGEGAGGGCDTSLVYMLRDARSYFNGSLAPFGDSWRDTGFPQTDRHPVTCVSWYDAQAYVAWLSRTTGMPYRLPTDAEWEQAAAGSQRGCDRERAGSLGTCPVGSYGSNAAGLSDMVGNLTEWVEDCWSADRCEDRVVRASSWLDIDQSAGFHYRHWNPAGVRYNALGFRVSRTLD